MKRKIVIIIFISLLITLCLVACENYSKKTITASEFRTIMESNGYTTTDITYQYKSDKHIKEVITASSKNDFDVSFYITDSLESAIDLFNTNKTYFEKQKSYISSEASTELANYSLFYLTTGGYYMYICRVDNTIFYARVLEAFKQPVNDIIEKLGY